MSQKSLIPNIKACVFDAYGTLFDVHSAVGKYDERLGEVADQLSSVWRTKQLEYTWLRSLMKKHVDFWQVTQDGLDYALDVFGITDKPLRDDLIDAYLHLNCYPEVPDTLAKLKDGGRQIAILSNGSPAMLEAVVKSSGLEDLVQTILSVEMVGVFKPDPAVYQLAVDRLGVAAAEIVFMSANAWDAVGATAFGLRVAWINRFAQRSERLSFQPDTEIKTLAELPDLLGV
ncbi:Haloacid dehalogenase, type II (EC [Olavius sp. associated proteobacterium Delta 1]|nr:Haloacid dehalogenase, type II (EC [Olavius sp. associated proteobacterium Delta 1]